jgi:hypothetical protein
VLVQIKILKTNLMGGRSWSKLEPAFVRISNRVKGGRWNHNDIDEKFKKSTKPRNEFGSVEKMRQHLENEYQTTLTNVKNDWNEVGNQWIQRGTCA